jgi:hypothetical protein
MTDSQRRSGKPERRFLADVNLLTFAVSWLFASLVPPRMQSQLCEFLAHLQSRYPEPAGGFGLIALGQVDGLSE